MTRYVTRAGGYILPLLALVGCGGQTSGEYAERRWAPDGSGVPRISQLRGDSGTFMEIDMARSIVPRRPVQPPDAGPVDSGPRDSGCRTVWTCPGVQMGTECLYSCAADGPDIVCGWQQETVCY